jgi:hypothetical protein
MRCVRCGWLSKNYEMSNDGRPAADPCARLDAAYLLGALGADERLAYEAHLAICRRCRAIFTSGTAVTGTQIKNLQITQPNGPAILAFGVPRLFRTADR